MTSESIFFFNPFKALLHHLKAVFYLVEVSYIIHFSMHFFFFFEMENYCSTFVTLGVTGESFLSVLTISSSADLLGLREITKFSSEL